jgi:hypothetical protein
MQNQKQPKLFAFKLAQQQEKQIKPAAQWKVREGVAVAGCSGPDMYDNYRGPRNGIGDTGVYC